MEKTSLTFTGTPVEIRLAVHTWDRSDSTDCSGISDPLKTFDLEGVSISDTDPAGLEQFDSTNKWQGDRIAELEAKASLLQSRVDTQRQSIEYYQNREDVAQLRADLKEAQNDRDYLTGCLKQVRENLENSLRDTKEAQHAAEVYRQQLDSLREAVAQTQVDFKEAAASNVRLYNRIHNAKAALES